MSKLLTSGQTENIGLKQLKQIRKQAQDKWANLGFLDGLSGHVNERLVELYASGPSALLKEVTITGDSKDLTVYETKEIKK